MTGTAASRGEVLEAQDDSLGHTNVDEPPFDVFSLLGPPKIEPTTKEEVEEEVYADPSTSPVSLPPLHTHNHPTQFESLATDPVFDEAEVDFGDEEPGDDLDDQAEPTPKEEQQEGDEADDETAPSAETSQTASAAVDPQPKRTRGARGSINSNSPTRSTLSHVILLQVTWHRILIVGSAKLTTCHS